MKFAVFVLAALACSIAQAKDAALEIRFSNHIVSEHAAQTGDFVEHR